MARPEIKTYQNLEAAFAGESMAHIKYRYFAKLARAAGDENVFASGVDDVHDMRLFRREVNGHRSALGRVFQSTRQHPLQP